MNDRARGSSIFTANRASVIAPTTNHEIANVTAKYVATACLVTNALIVDR